MKCPECGADLLPGVLFCRDCGCKIAQGSIRKCKKCGMALNETAKFCPECGANAKDTESDNANNASSRSRVIVHLIRDVKSDSASDSAESSDEEQESPIAPPIDRLNTSGTYNEASPDDNDDNGNSAIVTNSSSTDNLFTKALYVIAAIASLFALAALFSGKWGLVLLSMVQIGTLICAYNMHKGLLETNKYLNKYTVSALAAILLVISVFSLSSKKEAPSRSLEETETTVAVTVCKLYMDIKSEANLFFSTYDLELYLDGEEVGVISNGDEFTRLITLEIGKHEFVVYKSGNHNLKASRTLNLKGPTTFTTTLSHTSSSISFKKTSILDGIPAEYADTTTEEIFQTDQTDKQSEVETTQLQDITADTTTPVETPSPIPVESTQNIEGTSTEPSEHESEVASTGSSTHNDDNSDQTNGVLTKENNKDLAELLSLSYYDIQKQADFVNKYKGKVIEFDCIVYLIEQNPNFSTIYSYTLIPGSEMNADSIGCAFFYLEDMSMFDFNWDKSSRPGYLTLGSKIRIQAKVVTGDDTLYIYLKPVKSWGK